LGCKMKERVQREAVRGESQREEKKWRKKEKYAGGKREVYSSSGQWKSQPKPNGKGGLITYTDLRPYRKRNKQHKKVKGGGEDGERD